LLGIAGPQLKRANEWTVAHVMAVVGVSRHSAGSIVPLNQTVSNVRPVLAQKIRELLNAHPADARRALIAPNLLQGTAEIVPAQHTHYHR
jgi:hypothetical protein